MESWTKDKSEHMDFVDMQSLDSDLHVQLANGNLARFDDKAYSDLAHVYEASYETRYFDFGQPYHSKKLKEIQVFANAESQGQVAKVSVALDGVKRMEDAIMWDAKLVLTEDYNTFLDKLKVSGECLRAKVTVKHTIDEYASFLGFAFIIKLKKP